MDRGRNAKAPKVAADLTGNRDPFLILEGSHRKAEAIFVAPQLTQVASIRMLALFTHDSVRILDNRGVAFNGNLL